MPVALDEFPLHQAPLSMAYVASSDRNFYDRCYFNAHDRTGDLFVVTGGGIYPHLGVKDAYVAVRRGDVQRVVRMSDVLDEERMALSVGPWRIDVLEPLRRVRVRCDADEHGIGLDLTWDGAFPAVDEERHLLRQGTRPILDTWRFAQVGTWSGEIRLDGEALAVTPDTWVGSRDRSWGIRPVGEPEPPGRPGDPDFGFWWLYVPLRFERFAVVLIAQEDSRGHRTLNDAVRVWADGRVEQLGWPRVRVAYRPGSRVPTGARIGLTDTAGDRLVLDVSVLDPASVPLHVGCGYGGDPEWGHGQWRGPAWVSSSTYDMTDPAVAARVPWGVVDHVARATLDGETGYGLFEHASIGRHDPSGFADLAAVAP